MSPPTSKKGTCCLMLLTYGMVRTKIWTFIVVKRGNFLFETFLSSCMTRFFVENWHTWYQGHKKKIPFLEVGGHSHAPPTLSFVPKWITHFFSKWTCALQHLLLISLYIEGHKDKREYNCKLSKVLEKVVVVHIVKRYLTK